MILDVFHHMYIPKALKLYTYRISEWVLWSVISSLILKVEN